MRETLDDFIVRQNIACLRKQLDNISDHARRSQLLTLLAAAEAQAKFARANSLDQSP